VLSIVAILVTMLMPALSQVRSSSQRVTCTSNQKQLFVAWEAGMIDEKGIIPLTKRITGGKRWVDVLREQLPELRLLVSPDAKSASPSVCPRVESDYPNVLYFNGYVGYAVNTRWQDGQPCGANESQSWANVREPASYPWFADPYVSSSATPVGFSSFGFPSPDGISWMLGFHHAGQTTNSVFADGHAQAVSRDDLTESDSAGTPQLFLSDR
jgi:prepilin-type processing-associated H-X9-DG protein